MVLCYVQGWLAQAVQYLSSMQEQETVSHYYLTFL